MTKNLYYLILLVMFSVGATLKFAASHEEMPIGCDEFGYLNLAKTFDENAVVERPYFNELLSTLRGKGITENELSWLITPHAYHIPPGTNLAINQYQPGTSWLLSFFPYKSRKLLFPALVIVTLILLTVMLSGSYQKSQWNVFDLVFPMFLFLMTVSAPFTTELARVNSLSVTFGLLLSAGMAVRSRPLLACFLIALTVNFRIANILMVLPVLLFLPFSPLDKAEGRKQNFILLFQYGALILIAATPLLLYNYQLLGNPLASTYSVIDTALNKANTVLFNLKYYIRAKPHWLIFHLISLILLIFFCIKNKMNWIEFVKILSFPLINYIFFSWHKVTMDYYPYASALLLFGIALGLMLDCKIPPNWRTAGPVIGIILGVVVLVSGINRFRKKEHLTFEQAAAKYSALCEYDVVWSDLYSGTTEYVCSNNGFRFITSTPRARKIVMDYLQKKQLDQVIILKDVPLPPAEIVKEVQESGLVFNMSSDKQLGQLIVIPGNNTGTKINR